MNFILMGLENPLNHHGMIKVSIHTRVNQGGNIFASKMIKMSHYN